MDDHFAGLSLASAVWDEFAGRHPGHRFLELDPLYSLSEPLIDAVREQVPDFFTGDDEGFERDLARTAGFGFFYRRPFGRTARTIDGGTQEEMDRRAEESSRQIREMLEFEWRARGADGQDIEDRTGWEERFRTRVADLQNAYRGWLVSNPGYRLEVSRLRQRWAEAARAAGGFPRLPLFLMHDPTTELQLPRGFREECEAFYIRWGLQTLVTWDWPDAMDPDMGVGLRRNLNELDEGGLTLFVPWYMARGSLNLADVVRHSRIGAAPRHLSEWVHRGGAGAGGELGETRYATALTLYRFRELVLDSRYAENCQGRTAALDRAFAKLLGRDEDTVKKVRTFVARSLRSAVSEPVSEYMVTPAGPTARRRNADEDPA